MTTRYRDIDARFLPNHVDAGLVGVENTLVEG